MATRRAVLAGAAAVGVTGAMPAPRPRPEVFGHRGACAWRPEHTLASYAVALAAGADFIEPDLVVTRDGELVIRHENNIAETTDVAAHPAFASRRTEKLIDGERQTGWFTEDFTLAELKTLRARERLPALRPQNAAFDGAFDLVTWPELVDFAAAQASARGWPVGLVPELKHSTYFASIGLPLEDRFLASLAAHRYLATCPLVVQSFEVANLRYLRAKLGRRPGLRLMQLAASVPAGLRPADVAAAGGQLTYAAMLAPAGLREVARYADIVAPDTAAVVPPDAAGRPTRLVADAHAAGLQVIPYTFRPENHFLPADLRDGAGDAARNPAGSLREIGRHLAAGVDGFFTDDPALGRRAVDARAG